MFKVKNIEIDAAHDLIAILTEKDAQELGLSANERVKITAKNSKKSIICELEISDYKKRRGAHKDLDLKSGEIGLFESAFEKLDIWEGKEVKLIPAKKPKSVDYIRKKFSGERLSEAEFLEIMQDIVENRYSEIETTFFVLACTVNKLDDDETVALTNAMVKVGKVLDFKKKKNDVVVDKHCIGGIPGNRTTMIVVPIIAAAGLKIPKTSSRSITSPAGTADTMEVLAKVDVELNNMFHIVNEHNGCIVWGGGLELSPADDLIIQVEHPLELDSEGQMIASILSKKKSAGSTHVLIDIPIGESAKISSIEHAKLLKRKFEKIGKAIGLEVKVLITDGSEPIGEGVGPYYEAMDVLRILKNEPDLPEDLKLKALEVAGHIFEMANMAKKNQGFSLAKHILESGMAHEKFEAIRKAQGKKNLPKPAKFSKVIVAEKSGVVSFIDNKAVSKLAFVLGAPKDNLAGLKLYKKVGEKVLKGDALYEIFSNSKLKLKYGEHFIEENVVLKIK